MAIPRGMLPLEDLHIINLVISKHENAERFQNTRLITDGGTGGRALARGAKTGS